MGVRIFGAEIEPGYVFITVNTKAVGNDTPGDWNHCAIVSPRWTVIEAQQEPGCVIEVTLESFCLRYPEYLLYHPYYSAQQCNHRMAGHADNTIGARYVRYDSYFNFFSGFNCVSLIDYCYRKAIGQKRKMGWRTPDEVVRFAHNNWQFVHRHTDKKWIKPASWFEGRIR